MSKVFIEESTLTGIGDAVRAKTGKTDLIPVPNLKNEILGIQGGEEAPEKDVIFIDWDAYRLYSYTLDEAHALTELPPAPTRNDDKGFVFDGWNWTLDEIHEVDRPCEVGAMYHFKGVDGSPSTSNDVEYCITTVIPDEETYISCDSSKLDSVTIDWGDGNIEKLTAVTQTNPMEAHKYANPGTYIVKIYNIESISSSCYVYPWYKAATHPGKSNPNPSQFEWIISKNPITTLIGRTSLPTITSASDSGRLGSQYSYYAPSRRAIIFPRQAYVGGVTFNEGPARYISFNPAIGPLTTMDFSFHPSLRRLYIPAWTQRLKIQGTILQRIDLRAMTSTGYCDDTVNQWNSERMKKYFVLPAREKGRIQETAWFLSLPDDLIEWVGHYFELSNYFLKLLYNETATINLENISGDGAYTISLSTLDGVTAQIDGTTITIQSGEVDVSGEIVVTMTWENGDTIQQTITVMAKSEYLDPEYTVEAYPDGLDNNSTTKLGGSVYGFELKSSGYYESNNKTVDNSVAWAKVICTKANGAHIYVDCINFAEVNYDYGTIHNAGTLPTKYSEEIYKSLKGFSKADVQTVDMGLSDSDTFTFLVSYRKDSSSAQNNDSLQFKVRFE